MKVFLIAYDDMELDDYSGEMFARTIVLPEYGGFKKEQDALRKCDELNSKHNSLEDDGTYETGLDYYSVSLKVKE